MLQGMRFRTKILAAGKTPVANGKTPETRQRNIEKALIALREGKI